MKLHIIPGIAALVLGLAFTSSMYADSSTTYSGSFSNDNDVALFSIIASGTQEFTFTTTSYATGGFVPYLTLFSSSGAPLGFAGASGMCSGSMTADSSTGMCDDASLSQLLSKGTYTLALTEFPNTATGNLSDGFLFASDPNATGTLCGVSGGKFLQTDTGTCVQRSSNYSLSVDSTSPVPEPSTLLLVLTPIAFLAAGSIRRLI